MGLSVVFLDTGPLSEIVRRRGQNTDADACFDWFQALTTAGVRLCVAEVNDYELRRELLRADKTSSIRRLDALISVPGRYVPISTNAMRLAADLWAGSRKLGIITAPPQAIDGDAILAAQVQMFAAAEGIPLSEIIVATTNVRHIARFVQADEWSNIQP